MKNSKDEKQFLELYYASMADAVRLIENGVKSGLSLQDSLKALKKEVAERRMKIWRSDGKK